jgi:hypothetical protein
MMDPSAQLDSDVARFIDDQIDSVPHMEALLLLWQSRPEHWDAEKLGSRIYVTSGTALEILRDLARRKLARATNENPGRFAYDDAWDKEGHLMARAATAYRQHLIAFAQRIHSKASGAVREFARAFEIKRDE